MPNTLPAAFAFTCLRHIRTFDPPSKGLVGKDALMTQTEYVVDTYGMTRDQVVETNRFVLRLIAPNASSFETDIPLQGRSSSTLGP